MFSSNRGLPRFTIGNPKYLEVPRGHGRLPSGLDLPPLRSNG